ncbi:MAG: hypothetical protein H0X37_12030 [Herpetosiphonaceae bacterium]|nr:hypothetical protein [Herpetosiphonaceae bacterium]
MTTMPQLDPHTVLQVKPGATEEEVAAAYARLQALYSAERYVDGPVEFVVQAATKRDELATAYQALTQTRGEPKAEAAQEVPDFRPLPPARGQERAVPPVQANPAVPRLRKPTSHQRRPLLSLGLLLGTAGIVFALVSLPGVRTASSPAALATPVISGLDLPYSSAQIVTLRQAAQQTPSAANWSKLGDAIFDNLETLREGAPLSAQYQSAASGWSEATAAYRSSLTLQDDPGVRTDLALTLVYDGQARSDQVTTEQGQAEGQRAFEAAPDNARVALNYGLVLVALNPPQTATALQVWQTLVQHAPQSTEAQRAKQLLDSYKQ